MKTDRIFGFNVGQTYGIGTTDVKVVNENKLKITHNGNMGGSEDQLNQNLYSMNLLNLDGFKSQFETQNEKGSFDYLYEIEILLNKPIMK